jgi:uncharacterized protein YifN (PemK superfamily)
VEKTQTKKSHATVPLSSVADPHHFDADPICQVDADPDQTLIFTKFSNWIFSEKIQKKRKSGSNNVSSQ